MCHATDKTREKLCASAKFIRNVLGGLRSQLKDTLHNDQGDVSCFYDAWGGFEINCFYEDSWGGFLVYPNTLSIVQARQIMFISKDDYKSILCPEDLQSMAAIIWSTVKYITLAASCQEHASVVWNSCVVRHAGFKRRKRWWHLLASFEGISESGIHSWWEFCKFYCSQILFSQTVIAMVIVMLYNVSAVSSPSFFALWYIKRLRKHLAFLTS